jgi:hypothetical protein
VRITSGFGGGEFTKTLLKVCIEKNIENLTGIFVKNNLEM